MVDGRAEGSSALRDGQQAAGSLTSDADVTHICSFESSYLEGSYVRNLLYLQITIYLPTTFLTFLYRLNLVQRYLLLMPCVRIICRDS